MLNLTMSADVHGNDLLSLLAARLAHIRSDGRD